MRRRPETAPQKAAQLITLSKINLQKKSEDASSHRPSHLFQLLLLCFVLRSHKHLREDHNDGFTTQGMSKRGSVL